MEKVSNYLSQMHGQIVIGCWVMEVQYRNIVEKPNYYRSVEDFFSLSNEYQGNGLET